MAMGNHTSQPNKRTMKKNCVIALSTLTMFISCKGQNSDSNKVVQQQQKIEMTIEKFDIEKFDKNKIDGEYNFILEDGTQISQSVTSVDYLEYITPPSPKLFITSKQYFKSGELQTLIVSYPKRFVSKKNVYNRQGELIENVDYDNDYKLRLEDVLVILEKEVGKNVVKIADRLTTISRNNKNGAKWYVEYYDYQKKGYDKRIDEFNPSINLALIIIEELTIDDATSEITKRSYHPHNNN